jgi:hypothetical protein
MFRRLPAQYRRGFLGRISQTLKLIKQERIRDPAAAASVAIASFTETLAGTKFTYAPFLLHTHL